MMNASFDVTGATSLRQQIADHLRRKIQAGELMPGARLPSTAELAERWQAAPGTVQASMRQLVKEGLLDRKTRVGTFVRSDVPVLTAVATYSTRELEHGYEGGFFRALDDMVHRRLAERGIRAVGLVDPRADLDSPMPELQRMAERREVQGVIALAGGSRSFDWLHRLPVVISALSAAVGLTQRVYFDYREFLDLALESLAQAGCQRVGLITPYGICLDTRTDGPDEGTLMVRHFQERAASLALATSPDWVLCRSWEAMAQATDEAIGYHAFRLLWSRAQRPDGLIVANDLMARGVLTAVCQEQVRVPDDLRLVAHVNEGLGLFYPVPVTLVSTRIEELADALIDQVELQCRGTPIRERLVHFTLRNIEPIREPPWRSSLTMKSTTDTTTNP